MLGFYSRFGSRQKGLASGGLDDICGEEPLHVGVLSGGESAELQGGPAEHMVSCTPGRRASRAGPSPSVPNSRNWGIEPTVCRWGEEGADETRLGTRE